MVRPNFDVRSQWEDEPVVRDLIGRPEDVAEFVGADVAVGARTVTLIPVATDVHEAIELSGEVRRLLPAAVPA